MTNTIVSVPLEKLLPHPDNPNRMSRVNFKRLIRNIKQTGRYEPVIVREHPEKERGFQIINGHHRCKALGELDYKCADCVIWEIDDQQTDILLVTLNRLGGSDELGKKLVLLKRLAGKIQTSQLSKILPHPSKQIDRMINLKMKPVPANKSGSFVNPAVFFLTSEQQKVLEEALSAAEEADRKMTKAIRRAAGITCIASDFLQRKEAI